MPCDIDNHACLQASILWPAVTLAILSIHRLVLCVVNIIWYRCSFKPQCPDVKHLQSWSLSLHLLSWCTPAAPYHTTYCTLGVFYHTTKENSLSSHVRNLSSALCFSPDMVFPSTAYKTFLQFSHYFSHTWLSIISIQKDWQRIDILSAVSINQ